MSCFCTPCLGKFPMFAFTHGQEVNCEQFNKQGSAYCRECYDAASISHDRKESCLQACTARLAALSRGLVASAQILSNTDDSKAKFDQRWDLESIQRVRDRLRYLRSLASEEE